MHNFDKEILIRPDKRMYFPTVSTSNRMLDLHWRIHLPHRKNHHPRSKGHRHRFLFFVAGFGPTGYNDITNKCMTHTHTRVSNDKARQEGKKTHTHIRNKALLMHTFFRRSNVITARVMVSSWYSHGELLLLRRHTTFLWEHSLWRLGFHSSAMV